MIRYRIGKNNFEIPAFLPIEQWLIKSVKTQSNGSRDSKRLQYFKIIFPIPYPIIYNPNTTYIFLNCTSWKYKKY